VLTNSRTKRLILSWRGLIMVVALALSVIAIYPRTLSAAARFWCWGRHQNSCQSCPDGGGPPDFEFGGTWYWLRTPEEEKVVVTGLYNRYCIRCHGVDGRGVWDMPHIPDFTNVRWQQSRTDQQIAYIILNGRGAVMPPFRGTLALEEAFAMARYLRTFVPGTEVSPPDLRNPKDNQKKAK
jgi:hypothetical protein